MCTHNMQFHDNVRKCHKKSLNDFLELLEELHRDSKTSSKQPS